MNNRLKRFAFFLFSGLIAVGCDNGGQLNNNNPVVDTASAFAPMPSKERRIAIVHSETSSKHHYDEFIYNQLFAAAQQQARQAGLPFDLLSESQLASAVLTNYDAVVMPSFQHANSATRAAIRQNLVNAQQAGVAIIGTGEFMTTDENNRFYANGHDVLEQLFGLTPNQYISNKPGEIKVANTSHPITQSFATAESLRDFDQLWFAEYLPTSGESATVLVNIKSRNKEYPGLQTVARSGRVLHFTSEVVLVENNLLWKGIQWAVYGDVAPLSLQLSRHDSIFLARNDMDQAMLAGQINSIEVPLLDILKQWKTRYNFVGSHYIDIGDKPLSGLYTDWAVSAPLYQQYQQIGIEIGTHSWTHPHHVALLTNAQLDYEFKQSRDEIANRLGTPVTGGAVPGNAESISVVETLNPWFSYFSGRTTPFGAGYPAAIGFLKPSHSMQYFSLNMSPDYTLIDYLNYTPAQARQIWRDETDQLLKGTQQPVLHWLWHDYGPTSQSATGAYSRAMFDDTVAYAHQKGSEFVTLTEFDQRSRAFQATSFTLGNNATINAVVNGNNLGTFSLKVGAGQKIKNVANWYAFNDDSVLLPETGGEFSVAVGATADPISHITALPMRAKLIAVNGDGNELTFSFSGAGKVTVALSTAMVNNTTVSGADSFSSNANSLELVFNNDATHNVTISATTPLNHPPSVTDIEQNVTAQTVANITLTGIDPDGNALTYQIHTAPDHGNLSGTAPNLAYLATTGYTGIDSFTFSASDGQVQSNVATALLNVSPRPPFNTAPIANSQVLHTPADQPRSFIISGSDQENNALTFTTTATPTHGVISGTAPNLVYTPQAGFLGIDQLSFVANDGTLQSPSATVVFNVSALSPPSHGTLSNLLQSAPQIDGSLTDWGDSPPFGSDPLDVTGTNNDIDWREAWMAHDTTNFYLAHRTETAGSLSWGHSVFMDSDTNNTSGFKGFSNEYPIGADYVLEGAALFRYTGTNQNQWSWQYLGTATTALQGSTAEIAIARSQLGNPDNIRLFFYGDSAATNGTALDQFPDDATNSLAVATARRFSYSVNANSELENTAPVANAQSIKLTANTTVPVALTGSDANNDTLSFSLRSQPNHGTLTGTAPALAYQPDTGFVGTDSFTFVATDATLASNPAQVSIDVVARPTGNTTPVANPQNLTLPSGSSQQIQLQGSDADNDPLSFTVVTPPQNGTLSGTAPTLLYTPATSFTGTDSLSFTANDSNAQSTPATIALTVTATPVNTAPQANPQTLSTAYQTALGITLTGSDAEADPLNYSVSSQPQLGSLSGTAPNLTYTPFASAQGEDSFNFTVNDGTATSTAATISITVEAASPANRAPIANGQSLSTSSDTALPLTLTGSDPEAATLTYRITSQPGSGSLSGNAPQLIYTPNNGSAGLESFSFVVNDGALDSTAAVVTISVAQPTSGAVSNLVTSIAVDGSITDWNGLRSFGIDPDDVAAVPNNPLDWREAWAAHDATNFYFAYRNDGPFQVSWGHSFYIDVDSDATTGFAGFNNENPIGADFLIQSDSVHAYTGTGNNWSWQYLGASTIAAAGEIGEMSVPRSMLNNPVNLNLFMEANNEAFQGTLYDYMPQGALDSTAPATERFLQYTTTP